MTAQHEIDRLARMSPETLRDAMIVAETRRMRITRSELAALPEGERDYVSAALQREAMDRASAKFLIALRSGRCIDRKLVGEWPQGRKNQYTAYQNSEPRWPGQLTKRLAYA